MALCGDESEHEAAREAGLGRTGLPEHRESSSSHRCSCIALSDRRGKGQLELAFDDGGVCADLDRFYRTGRLPGESEG